MPDAATAFLVIVAVIALYLFSCIRVLNEYERGVIFRLGRVLSKPKGPGLFFVFWPIDWMTRVDLRVVTRIVEPQDVITRDNVSVKVNAVLYFRVVDPLRSVLEVADYLQATSQVALTTLRSTVGQAELDELLAERDRLNRRLQEVIDGHTEPWGIKVTAVEVKDVDLPERMQRAMARQAEAERDAPRQGDQRRGRVPGRPTAPRGGGDHDALSHGPADAVFAGPRRGGVGEQFHDCFPAAPGPAATIPGRK